jgi:hypothetical protein
LHYYCLTQVVLAENQKKEISVDEALKYYCQIWINPAYYENPNMSGLKRMNRDRTFEWYSNEANENKDSPSWSGTFEFEKSWVDKDGNVWINLDLYVMGYVKYTLAKISDDGNTLEQMYSFSYPTEMDPNHKKYFIMFKQ